MGCIQSLGSPWSGLVRGRARGHPGVTTRGQRTAKASLVLILVASALLPGRTSAQATPYVLLSDPAYGDVELLMARGLVSGLIAGSRPFSRLDFARAAAEATIALREAESRHTARLREAVARLEREFAPELAELHCAENDDCPGLGTGLRIRSLTWDVTAADSPDRETRSDLQPGLEIDATTNPLLQRNGGRVLRTGTTMGAEGTIDLSLSPSLVGQVTPRLWSNTGRPGVASLLEMSRLPAGYPRERRDGPGA
mgnify:CR=1 FL=1